MATFVHGHGLVSRRAIHHSSVFYLFERCFDLTRIHPYLRFLGDWQTIGARLFGFPYCAISIFIFCLSIFLHRHTQAGKE